MNFSSHSENQRGTNTGYCGSESQIPSCAVRRALTERSKAPSKPSSTVLNLYRTPLLNNKSRNCTRKREETIGRKHNTNHMSYSRPFRPSDFNVRRTQSTQFRTMLQKHLRRLRNMSPSTFDIVTHTKGKKRSSRVFHGREVVVRWLCIRSCFFSEVTSNRDVLVRRHGRCLDVP